MYQICSPPSPLLPEILLICILFHMEYLRYCGLYIPYFSSQVWRQSHPGCEQRPFAIASTGPLGILLHQSPASRRLRIPPATPAAEVRLRWPSVYMLPPQEKAEQEALARLRALCEAQTPAWEWKDGFLLLDLQGTERLHGKDQKAWLKRLLAQLQSQGYSHLRAALAPSRAAASLLGRLAHAPRPQIFPESSLRAALALVPLSSVPGLDGPAHALLRSHKLFTLGDIQRLDRRLLLSHFGETGEMLYAKAQGLDLRPAPRTPACEREYSPPLSLRATLRSECAALAGQLASHLRRGQQLLRQLEISLYCADGRLLSRKGSLDLQSSLEAVSLRALSLLEELDPAGSPVLALRCSALKVCQAEPQTELF